MTKFRAMTLIELLVFSGLIISTYLGGSYLRLEVGPVPNWLVGGGLAGSAYVVILAMGMFAYVRLFVGSPYLPVCQTGRCRSDDYGMVIESSDVTWKCSCGDTYRRVGKRFVKIVDGKECPYLAWSPIKGWKPDT